MPQPAKALAPQYEKAFKRELAFILEKARRGHVPYTWGGSSENISKGLDCSGYIFRAGRNAGLPVRRTTSRRMARGEGGWVGIKLAWGMQKEGDLIFWTFKEGRPNGHVGIVYGDDKHVTHSSKSRNKPVVDVIKGILVSTVTELIRLKLQEAMH